MERYWWKNTESEQILNRGYLLQGETVEGAIDRVCTAAAKNLFRPELKEGFKFSNMGKYGYRERATDFML